MTALPSIASFTAPTVTEGEFKTALSNMHLFLSGLLGTTGAAADAQAALGALLGAGVETKTGAYTVQATDRGKVVACSGTFTVTLPDAGAVGDGFAVAIGNYGSGSITIDPFSSQTLDGALSRTLSANRMMVVCAINGEWLSVGGIGAASTGEAGVVQLIDSVVSTSQILAPTANACRVAYETGVYGQTLANNAQGTANASWNNAEGRVPKDCGHNNIGSLCFAKNMSAAAVAPGSTIAGSNLRPSDAYGTTVTTTLSGTWRALGNGRQSSTDYLQQGVTLWQRIS